MSLQNNFDRMVDMTVDALADPTLRKHIGELALDIEGAASNLFLPEVEDGIASRPGDLSANASYCMLPVQSLRNSPIVRIDETLLAQSPARRAASGLQDLPGPLIREVKPAGSNVLGTTRFKVWLGANAHIGQPVIYVNRRIVTSPKLEPLAPVVVAHETLHAIDYDGTIDSDEACSEEFKALTEYRAHRLSAVIFRQQCAARESSSKAYQCIAKTVIFDNLCQTLDIPIDATVLPAFLVGHMREQGLLGRNMPVAA